MKYWAVPRCFEGRTVAVCASGPSMSHEVADALQEADIPVISVNTTHRLTPWGWMAYAADDEWWLHPDNKDAFDFAGHKVTLAYPETDPLERRGVQRMRRENHHFTDDPCSIVALGNSGAQAIQIAVKTGAARVLLCGFDFHAREGHHWHGDHPVGLRKTDPDLFASWAARLESLAPELLKRCQIINCTPNSALKCFPLMRLADALSSPMRKSSENLMN